MSKEKVQLLPQKQAQQLQDLSERARLNLARYAGVEVEYNAVGVQMLDEWIDRHLRQFPTPSGQIVTVWAAFLGEVFRQRFNGRWITQVTPDGKSHLGVACPKGPKNYVFINVMDQIQKRIHDGMQESLAFYYTLTGMEIKAG
ncbi:MAG: hypothetical protein JW981_06575 [Anaerolineae bacterium]|nr:hypothetical protein [Anaerolineae bacterium]